MIDGTERRCDIWRKTDLSFQKWHEEFSKFSPDHVWKSKNWNLWGSFIQSRKYMSLKFTGEFCVLTMKNDTKLEEELTCQFEIDIRDFFKFCPEHSKISKICSLIGCFWPKYLMFELKKSIAELCLTALKINAKF